jgi:uncharacterized protein YjeT (DUF2065 family)
MNTVIKIIGIFIVTMGLIYLTNPQTPKAIMRFFAKGSRLYFAAILRFALAIVFFMGARECDMVWVIVVFGLIMLLSGLLIFMLGLEKSKEIINWFEAQPMFMQRILAIIVLAVGLIIVYAA